jgi:chromosome segregation ATPase
MYNECKVPGKKYKKTAKDIAFDMERAQYKKQIRELQNSVDLKNRSISELNLDIDNYKESIAYLNSEVDKMLLLLGMDKKDLDSLLTREKEQQEFEQHMASVFGVSTKLLRGGFGGISL